MKDSLKNYSADLAAEIQELFQSSDVKKLVTDTKATSDTDTGTFQVVITTENVDRYDEVISLAGWDLTNYLNNPVVLWMHDHTQPIGVATSLDIKDGKMIAQGKFAANAKGQEVRQLYDSGIIRAASVGFLPKEQQGNLITKAELLEFSFVSVPANPYALALAMEKSLNVNELVTKGFMFVEKAQEDETVPSTVPESVENPEVSTETPVEAPVEPQERSFSTKQLSPVIESLKSALVALEALGTKSEESEGDDVKEDDVQTDEEKSFAEFSAKRKLLQDAVTVLGDVLAETRKVKRPISI